MSKRTIKTKSSRQDYEHLEREVDGSWYWWINKDVLWARQSIRDEVKAFGKWFDEEELKYQFKSLYYKGTRLYFTYGGLKYHVSWTFYSKLLIKEAIDKLISMGAVNIQINYGELD